MPLLDTRLHLRMSGADRRAWTSAATLEDLGETTAQWLTGHLASHPAVSPGYGPDPETTPLIGTLVAANRAGFVTLTSQPGAPTTTGPDGPTWRQRPAVHGFIAPDSPLQHALLDAATDAGMLTVLHDQNIADHHRIAVTERDRSPVTVLGHPLTRRDLRRIWRGYPRPLTATLHAAQLTIADPTWAASDDLWALLRETVADHTGDGPSCIGCGCTENRACPGGCWWVPTTDMIDLCSACAPGWADQDDSVGAPTE